jgi:hypothetical protein
MLTDSAKLRMRCNQVISFHQLPSEYDYVPPHDIRHFHPSRNNVQTAVPPQLQNDHFFSIDKAQYANSSGVDYLRSSKLDSQSHGGQTSYENLKVPVIPDNNGNGSGVLRKGFSARSNSSSPVSHVHSCLQESWSAAGTQPHKAAESISASELETIHTALTLQNFLHRILACRFRDKTSGMK